MKSDSYKKISIITPAYNSEKYIEKCINSIMAQNYPNYEHIVIDGGSTDNTVEILKKYENKYPLKWISEKDNGMYDAINKGFAMATGEIFAWINSDDIYFPWAFNTMNKVMQNENIQWCTMGHNAYTNENDEVFFTTRTLGPRSYSKKFLQKGYYDGRILGFVQQEATFWTAELWKKSGGLDSSKHLAGDYWLWRNFAQFEQLYSANTVISAFRKHDIQLSSDMSAYFSELPDLSLVKRIFGKSRLCLIYTGLFHPFHKYLIQIEDL